MRRFRAMATPTTAAQKKVAEPRPCTHPDRRTVDGVSASMPSLDRGGPLVPTHHQAAPRPPHLTKRADSATGAGLSRTALGDWVFPL
jgi:hypothetical protein